jgi:asparagine synthase (glutamine-hydrolysing)
VDLHVITVGPEMVELLETMIYHLDEPQADLAPINVYLICQLAREHGVKVLLSGAGGDDILSGYRRHHALTLEKYWSWMPRWTRKLVQRTTRMAPASHRFGRQLRKAFEFADADDLGRIAGYYYWNSPAFLKTLMVEGEEREAELDCPLKSAITQLPSDMAALNKMLYLDAKFFLADHNLNYTDKLSMAHGVEVRVPLLDPDLVAFSARLPTRMKQNGATGKWLFKKAMEDFLPHDVVYRPKAGFGAPLRTWLRGELRPLVEDVLSEASLVRRGLFDPRGVRRMVELDRSGVLDAAYPILALISIELWCRIFLDSAGRFQPHSLGETRLQP